MSNSPWLSPLPTTAAKSVAGATLLAGRNRGEAATWPASDWHDDDRPVGIVIQQGVQENDRFRCVITPALCSYPSGRFEA